MGVLVWVEEGRGGERGTSRHSVDSLHQTRGEKRFTPQGIYVLVLYSNKLNVSATVEPKVHVGTYGSKDCRGRQCLRESCGFRRKVFSSF